MFKVRFGILIAVFVLFVSGIMVAQQDTTGRPPVDRDFETETFQEDANTTTQPWTDDLRSRLNLTDDQVTEVNDIMLRYQRESTTLQSSPETMTTDRSELQNRYSTEIESILDEDQRTQWRSYSNTWWDNINTQNMNDRNLENQDFENQENQDQYDTETQDQYDTETDTETQDTETDSDIR
jgi:hypothetical protein